MTDQNKEMKQRLSMLMDSELDARDNPRLLDRIINDEELKRTWERYHLIGQAINAPKGVMAESDFAARVSSAIQAEPTVLSPRQASRNGGDKRHKFVTVALAASLMGVALLIGKSLNNNAGDLYQASIISKTAANQSTDQRESSGNLADAQFNDYLVTHSQTAYLAGSAGMLPYVRLVSSGNDR